MEAIAKAKFARYSPRKVGQVLGLIRGKSVAKAYGILPSVPRAAGILVFKTLKSASAGRPWRGSPLNAPENMSASTSTPHGRALSSAKKARTLKNSKKRFRR